MMSNQNEAEKLTPRGFLLSNKKWMNDGWYLSIEDAQTYSDLVHATRIEELEREVEQLKAWNDSANERTEFWQNECDIAVKAAMKSQDEVERLKQSVEYWKNENSKTGNSYLKLLGEHNDLKSEKTQRTWNL
jgi:chromosome segregation ATPase